MERLVLRKDVLDLIWTTPTLFGKVAEVENLTVRSLSDWFANRNRHTKLKSRLATASVIAVLKSHTGKQDSDLLEQIPNEKAAA